MFPDYAKRVRVAALVEGALVPAPIVRAVSCYETRRASVRAREKVREKEREKERGGSKGKSESKSSG